MQLLGHGVVASVVHCVCKFYLDRAVPGTTNYVAMSQVADSVRGAVDVLVEKGYIRQSEGLCQLTSDGVRALQLTQVLVQPAALLSLEQGKMVDKRSSAALLHFLVQEGFSLQLVSGKDHIPAYGPFTDSNCPPNKVLAIRAGRKTIDREYMLCVALVQDSSHRQKLLKLGINAIEHLMPPAFYTALNRVDEAALQTVLMLADAGDDDAGWAARAQMVREGWKRRVNYRLEESGGVLASRAQKRHLREVRFVWGTNVIALDGLTLSSLPRGYYPLPMDHDILG